MGLTCMKMYKLTVGKVFRISYLSHTVKAWMVKVNFKNFTLIF